jgi:peptidoglycan/LPS O-acetylase OafA/YrhL
MAGRRQASGQTLPAIDWLKGFAIIAVVCVHAKVYETSFVHLHVINRGVPLFLVLFGATSEMFWERHGAEPPKQRLRDWYRKRFARLVPPVWAMAAAWLTAMLLLGQAAALNIGWREAALCFIGYSPWMATAWFITLVLQLVILFPALRWLTVRLGPFVMLPLVAALSAYVTYHVWDVVELGRAYVSKNLPAPGFFYYWVFVPRVLWQVTAGIYVARYWCCRPRLAVTLVAAAVWVIGSKVLLGLPLSPAEHFVGPVRHQALENLLDVPLAIALLGFFSGLERWDGNFFLRFLAFCGRASWGIYVGHALAFELLHLEGIAIETGPSGWRITYAVLLLVIGISLAVVSRLLWRVVARATRLPMRA